MEALLQNAAQHMRAHGFEVVELETAREARDYLVNAIAQGSTVGLGGSVSVREIGVLPALEARGCTLYSGWGVTPEEAKAMREKARTADVYLCSANAITRTGQLVLVDGMGNRVGAVCDGPHTVYFVVSHSKVVDGGINTAIARIKKTACPQNAHRLGLDTPCAHTGLCGGESCTDSMCRVTLAVDRVPRGRRMVVLFVAEALGY